MQLKKSSNWYKNSERRQRENRKEQLTSATGIGIIAILAVACSFSIAYSNANSSEPEAPPPNAIHTVATAITTPSAPKAAYITSAVLDELEKHARGASGKLRVSMVL